jgi:hypothetical protein
LDIFYQDLQKVSRISMNKIKLIISTVTTIVKNTLSPCYKTAIKLLKEIKINLISAYNRIDLNVLAKTISLLYFLISTYLGVSENCVYWLVIAFKK